VCQCRRRRHSGIGQHRLEWTGKVVPITHCISKHVIIRATRLGVIEHAVLDTPSTDTLGCLELVDELLSASDAARPDCGDLVGDVRHVAGAWVNKEVLTSANMRSPQRPTSLKRVEMPPVAMIPQRRVEGVVEAMVRIRTESCWGGEDTRSVVARCSI
jgi:hypothetical protein